LLDCPIQPIQNLSARVFIDFSKYIQILWEERRWMKFTKWANNKIGKLTWIDIGLTKLSVAAFVLMIARLWPPLLSLDWYWYDLIFVVLVIIPLRNFWS
jgi:hypothetical protein